MEKNSLCNMTALGSPKKSFVVQGLKNKEIRLLGGFSTFYHYFSEAL